MPTGRSTERISLRSEVCTCRLAQRQAQRQLSGGKLIGGSSNQSSNQSGGLSVQTEQASSVVESALNKIL